MSTPPRADPGSGARPFRSSARTVGPSALLAAVLLSALTPSSVAGQGPPGSPAADRATREPTASSSTAAPRFVVPAALDPLQQNVPASRSAFWVPFGSILLPGLGQYIHRATWTGVAYTSVSVAGLAVAGQESTPLATLPRSAAEQVAFEATHFAVTAGMLSAWDAFNRATADGGANGEYAFLGDRDEVTELLTAPFDLRFLTRWTTLVDLAFSLGVAGYVLADDDPGLDYAPFRFRDGVFVTSLSFNAAVGEEALFRGWLLPMFTARMNDRFWLANSTQATIFALGHLPQADRFALVIGASALYGGWLTRRNGWSVREAIFQHFWYDVFVGTATLIRDRDAAVRLPVMTIRF